MLLLWVLLDLYLKLTDLQNQKEIIIDLFEVFLMVIQFNKLLNVIAIGNKFYFIIKDNYLSSIELIDISMKKKSILPDAIWTWLGCTTWSELLDKLDEADDDGDVVGTEKDNLRDLAVFLNV